MGLDARDCRLDIAFILGDRNIPDDVSWADELRDRSCVWLDFIDAQFDPCVRRRYDSCSDTTELDSALTESEDNTILYADNLATALSLDEVTSYPSANAVVARVSSTAGIVRDRGSVVSTKLKDDAVCVLNNTNTVAANRRNNVVTVKNTSNIR